MASLRRIKRCTLRKLDAYVPFIVRPVAFLYAMDLDKLEHNSAKDGYGPFTSLAGFAVAQSVALTAVARGERHKGLVLGIYIATVLMTLFWASSLLRSFIKQTDSAATAPSVPTRLRAYDKPSIKYGRWTLTWILLVGFLMIVLAINNLLPNQTERVEFTAPSIACSATLLSSRQDLWPAIGGSRLDRSYMDIWTKWLSTAVLDNPQKQRLIWIEQNGKFTENHTSFAMRLDCESHFTIRGRAAFLVSSDEGSARPVYRQIAFRLENDKESRTLRIQEPNAGEFIVAIALIEAIDQTGEQMLTAGDQLEVGFSESK